MDENVIEINENVIEINEIDKIAMEMGWIFSYSCSNLFKMSQIKKKHVKGRT